MREHKSERLSVKKCCQNSLLINDNNNQLWLSAKKEERVKLKVELFWGKSFAALCLFPGRWQLSAARKIVTSAELYCWSPSSALNCADGGSYERTECRHAHSAHLFTPIASDAAAARLGSACLSLGVRRARHARSRRVMVRCLARQCRALFSVCAASQANVDLQPPSHSRAKKMNNIN